MTELRAILSRPDVQAKIKEGKERVQNYRAAAEPGREHPSLLTDWDSKHQKIIGEYISEVITFMDQFLANNPDNLSKEQMWSELWRIEEKQASLKGIAAKYKRQFDNLIESRYMKESFHGGPLYFLFDDVGTKVAAAVFKLKFGES